MSAPGLPSAAEIRPLLELAEKRDLLREGAAFDEEALREIEDSMRRIIRKLYDGIGPPGSREFDGQGPPGSSEDFNGTGPPGNSQ